MKRPISTLLLLGLAACDVGLGTGPRQMELEDLAPPPSNSATVVVTQRLVSGVGVNNLDAWTQYGYTLRTPPPLPELLYDIAIGSSSVQLILDDIDATGLLVTGTNGVAFRFVGPDGALYEPITTCRITITSAWADTPGARLQGRSDCPVTDGTLDLRVLIKFDYTVPAG